MASVVDTLRTKGAGGALSWIALGAVLWAGVFVANEFVWDYLLFDLLGADPTTPLVAAIHFFVYDLIKIVLLLLGITFAVTFLQSFISVEKTQEWLTGKKEGVGHLLAAVLGVVTPFCSCSSVPLFIGFVRAGIPLGITMTFLVASPLVSEIAFVLLIVYFGWQVAFAYLVAGFVIAVFAGWLIQRLKLEKWLEPFVTKSLAVSVTGGPGGAVAARQDVRLRISVATAEATSVLRSVFPYLLVGLLVGAGLHGWVPDEVIRQVAGADNWFAVPLMVLIGIPLYGGAASVLPLVQTLAASGVPVGTLLALMMSVIALSLPEMILLKRVMKLKLLATFIGIVAVSIIAVGYLLNGWV
jgi:uncharacterized protein